MADPSGGVQHDEVRRHDDPATLPGPARVASIIQPVDSRTSDSTAPGTDGRTLRRGRNRAAVIHATLELIREGDLSPATADIAERAGVSHRSVFRYFDDLGNLVREAINIEFASAVEVGYIHDIGEGTLDDRIAAIVTARINVYDHTFGVSRVARFRAGQIVEIDHALAEIASMLRVQLRRQFDPELSSKPPEEQDSVVDAILMLTDFTPYDIMRRMLGYDHERIAAVWTHSMRTLLTCPPRYR